MTRRAIGELVAWVVAGLIAAWLGVAGCRYVMLCLMHPYPIEYGEGVVLNWVLQAQAGRPLYPELTDRFPFTHNPYMPLFYLLAAPLQSLVGGLNLFLAGRALSVAALLVCGLAMFGLVRGRGGVAAAWGATGLLVLSPVLLRFGAMERVDLLGVAFAAVSLLLLERDTRRCTVAAGVLAGCALLVKPTLVAAAVAGLCVSLGRGRSRLAVFVPALAGSLAAGLLVSMVRAGSDPVAHLIRMNLLPADALHAADLLGTVFGRHPVLVAAMVLYLGLRCRDRDSLWWFGLASLAGCGLAAKIGSQENYFLELLFAGAAAAGRVAGSARPPLRGLAVWLLIAQYLLYVPVRPATVYSRTYGQELAGTSTSVAPTAEERSMGELITAEIAAAQGMVLSEDVGYTLCGGKPELLEPYQFQQLARQGRWSDAPVVRAIQDGGFALIVLGTDPAAGESEYFTRAMLEAMAGRYRIKRIVGRYFLLEPTE